MAFADQTAAAAVDQRIRFSAWLSALPTVSTSPTERIAQRALPAVTDTECSVNKALQFYACLLTNRLDFEKDPIPAPESPA